MFSVCLSEEREEDSVRAFSANAVRPPPRRTFAGASPSAPPSLFYVHPASAFSAHSARRFGTRPPEPPRGGEEDQPLRGTARPPGEPDLVNRRRPFRSRSHSTSPAQEPPPPLRPSSLLPPAPAAPGGRNTPGLHNSPAGEWRVAPVRPPGAARGAKRAAVRARARARGTRPSSAPRSVSAGKFAREVALPPAMDAPCIRAPLGSRAQPGSRCSWSRAQRLPLSRGLLPPPSSYLKKELEADVNEIMRQLPREKNRRYTNLGFYVVAFILVVYR